MNYNNEDTLSLAYIDIKENIPDYIIINPCNNIKSIECNNIKFEKKNTERNAIIVEIRNSEEVIYISNINWTLCWLIIIFISIILIVLWAIFNFKLY
tara:strand:- start:17796 stop:18086 length:291 start_codon:yes stop_codon:yes gene_type:complete